MTERLKLNGQWTGEYFGSTGGRIIVNIDELDAYYQGVAYLWPTDLETFPVTAGFFKTVDKNVGGVFKFQTNSILPINPETLAPAPWDQVKHRFPKTVGFSKSAEV